MRPRYYPGSESRNPYVYGHNEIEMGISQLAERLSYRSHRFVASISTQDIDRNLTREYATISEKINDDHKALSQELNRAIKAYEKAAGQSRADETLETIRLQVQAHSTQQELLLRPFTRLNTLIRKIFQHKGIQVPSGLTLGDATARAITSDALSAGEKQMLSFLAYNAFERSSVIIIDEPEISLHVDWQRTLFPILLDQGTENQFIIATHSPFIYSKYADKEVLLGEDRGDVGSAS
jgi:predicted ATP-dependent endonuclease of OLD family